MGSNGDFKRWITSLSTAAKRKHNINNIYKVLKRVDRQDKLQPCLNQLMKGAEVRLNRLSEHTIQQHVRRPSESEDDETKRNRRPGPKSRRTKRLRESKSRKLSEPGACRSRRTSKDSQTPASSHPALRDSPVVGKEAQEHNQSCPSNKSEVSELLRSPIQPGSCNEGSTKSDTDDQSNQSAKPADLEESGSSKEIARLKGQRPVEEPPSLEIQERHEKSPSSERIEPSVDSAETPDKPPILEQQTSCEDDSHSLERQDRFEDPPSLERQEPCEDPPISEKPKPCKKFLRLESKPCEGTTSSESKNFSNDLLMARTDPKSGVSELPKRFESCLERKKRSASCDTPRRNTKNSNLRDRRSASLQSSKHMRLKTLEKTKDDNVCHIEKKVCAEIKASDKLKSIDAVDSCGKETQRAIIHDCNIPTSSQLTKSNTSSEKESQLPIDSVVSISSTEELDLCSAEETMQKLPNKTVQNKIPIVLNRQVVVNKCVGAASYQNIPVINGRNLLDIPAKPETSKLEDLSAISSNSSTVNKPSVKHVVPFYPDKRGEILKRSEQTLELSSDSEYSTISIYSDDHSDNEIDIHTADPSMPNAYFPRKTMRVRNQPINEEEAKKLSDRVWWLRYKSNFFPEKLSCHAHYPPENTNYEEESWAEVQDMYDPEEDIFLSSMNEFEEITDISESQESESSEPSGAPSTSAVSSQSEIPLNTEIPTQELPLNCPNDSSLPIVEVMQSENSTGMPESSHWPPALPPLETSFIPLPPPLHCLSPAKPPPLPCRSPAKLPSPPLSSQPPGKPTLPARSTPKKPQQKIEITKKIQESVPETSRPKISFKVTSQKVETIKKTQKSFQLSSEKNKMNQTKYKWKSKLKKMNSQAKPKLNYQIMAKSSAFAQKKKNSSPVKNKTMIDKISMLSNMTSTNTENRKECSSINDDLRQTNVDLNTQKESSNEDPHLSESVVFTDDSIKKMYEHAFKLEMEKSDWDQLFSKKLKEKEIVDESDYTEINSFSDVSNFKKPKPHLSHTEPKSTVENSSPACSYDVSMVQNYVDSLMKNIKESNRSKKHASTTNNLPLNVVNIDRTLVEGNNSNCIGQLLDIKQDLQLDSANDVKNSCLEDEGQNYVDSLMKNIKESNRSKKHSLTTNNLPLNVVNIDSTLVKENHSNCSGQLLEVKQDLQLDSANDVKNSCLEDEEQTNNVQLSKIHEECKVPFDSTKESIDSRKNDKTLDYSTIKSIVNILLPLGSKFIEPGPISSSVKPLVDYESLSETSETSHNESALEDSLMDTITDSKNNQTSRISTASNKQIPNLEIDLNSNIKYPVNSIEDPAILSPEEKDLSSTFEYGKNDIKETTMTDIEMPSKDLEDAIFTGVSIEDENQHDGTVPTTLPEINAVQSKTGHANLGRNENLQSHKQGNIFTTPSGEQDQIKKIQVTEHSASICHLDISKALQEIETSQTVTAEVSSSPKIVIEDVFSYPNVLFDQDENDDFDGHSEDDSPQSPTISDPEIKTSDEDLGNVRPRIINGVGGPFFLHYNDSQGTAFKVKTEKIEEDVRKDPGLTEEKSTISKLPKSNIESYSEKELSKNHCFDQISIGPTKTKCIIDQNILNIKTVLEKSTPKRTENKKSLSLSEDKKTTSSNNTIKLPKHSTNKNNESSSKSSPLRKPKKKKKNVVSRRILSDTASSSDDNDTDKPGINTKELNKKINVQIHNLSDTEPSSDDATDFSQEDKRNAREINPQLTQHSPKMSTMEIKSKVQPKMLKNHKIPEFEKNCTSGIRQDKSNINKSNTNKLNLCNSNKNVSVRTNSSLKKTPEQAIQNQSQKGNLEPKNLNRAEEVSEVGTQRLISSPSSRMQTLNRYNRQLSLDNKKTGYFLTPIEGLDKIKPVSHIRSRQIATEGPGDKKHSNVHTAQSQKDESDGAKKSSYKKSALKQKFENEMEQVVLINNLKQNKTNQKTGFNNVVSPPNKTTEILKKTAPQITPSCNVVDSIMKEMSSCAPPTKTRDTTQDKYSSRFLPSLDDLQTDNPALSHAAPLFPSRPRVEAKSAEPMTISNIRNVSREAQPECAKAYKPTTDAPKQETHFSVQKNVSSFSKSCNNNESHVERKSGFALRFSQPNENPTSTVTSLPSMPVISHIETDSVIKNYKVIEKKKDISGLANSPPSMPKISQKDRFAENKRYKEAERKKETNGLANSPPLKPIITQKEMVAGNKQYKETERKNESNKVANSPPSKPKISHKEKDAGNKKIKEAGKKKEVSVAYSPPLNPTKSCKEKDVGNKKCNKVEKKNEIIGPVNSPPSKPKISHTKTDVGKKFKEAQTKKEIDGSGCSQFIQYKIKPANSLPSMPIISDQNKVLIVESNPCLPPNKKLKVDTSFKNAERKADNKTSKLKFDQSKGEKIKQVKPDILMEKVKDVGKPESGKHELKDLSIKISIPLSSIRKTVLKEGTKKRSYKRRSSLADKEHNKQPKPTEKCSSTEKGQCIQTPNDKIDKPISEKKIERTPNLKRKLDLNNSENHVAKKAYSSPILHTKTPAYTVVHSSSLQLENSTTTLTEEKMETREVLLSILEDSPTNAGSSSTSGQKLEKSIPPQVSQKQHSELMNTEMPAETVSLPNPIMKNSSGLCSILQERPELNQAKFQGLPTAPQLQSSVPKDADSLINDSAIFTIPEETIRIKPSNLLATSSFNDSQNEQPNPKRRLSVLNTEMLMTRNHFTSEEPNIRHTWYMSPEIPETPKENTNIIPTINCTDPMVEVKAEPTTQVPEITDNNLQHANTSPAQSHITPAITVKTEANMFAQYLKDMANDSKRQQFITSFENSMMNGKSEFVKLYDIINCINLDHKSKLNVIDNVKMLTSQDLIDMEISRANTDFKRKFAIREACFKESFDKFIKHFEPIHFKYPCLVLIFKELKEKVVIVCEEQGLRNEMTTFLKKMLVLKETENIYTQDGLDLEKDCETVSKVFNEIADGLEETHYIKNSSNHIRVPIKSEECNQPQNSPSCSVPDSEGNSTSTNQATDKNSADPQSHCSYVVNPNLTRKDINSPSLQSSDITSSSSPTLSNKSSTDVSPSSNADSQAKNTLATINSDDDTLIEPTIQPSAVLSSSNSKECTRNLTPETSNVHTTNQYLPAKSNPLGPISPEHFNSFPNLYQREQPNTVARPPQQMPCSVENQITLENLLRNSNSASVTGQQFPMTSNMVQPQTNAIQSMKNQLRRLSSERSQENWNQSSQLSASTYIPRVGPAQGARTSPSQIAPMHNLQTQIPGLRSAQGLISDTQTSQRYVPIMQKFQESISATQAAPKQVPQSRTSPQQIAGRRNSQRRNSGPRSTQGQVPVSRTSTGQIPANQNFHGYNHGMPATQIPPAMHNFHNTSGPTSTQGQIPVARILPAQSIANHNAQWKVPATKISPTQNFPGQVPASAQGQIPFPGQMPTGQNYQRHISNMHSNQRVASNAQDRNNATMTSQRQLPAAPYTTGQPQATSNTYSDYTALQTTARYDLLVPTNQGSTSVIQPVIQSYVPVYSQQVTNYYHPTNFNQVTNQDQLYRNNYTTGSNLNYNHNQFANQVNTNYSNNPMVNLQLPNPNSVNGTQTQQAVSTTQNLAPQTILSQHYLNSQENFKNPQNMPQQRRLNRSQSHTQQVPFPANNQQSNAQDSNPSSIQRRHSVHSTTLMQQEYQQQHISNLYQTNSNDRSSVNQRSSFTNQTGFNEISSGNSTLSQNQISQCQEESPPLLSEELEVDLFQLSQLPQLPQLSDDIFQSLLQLTENPYPCDSTNNTVAKKKQDQLDSSRAFIQKILERIQLIRQDRCRIFREYNVSSLKMSGYEIFSVMDYFRQKVEALDLMLGTTVTFHDDECYSTGVRTFNAEELKLLYSLMIENQILPETNCDEDQQSTNTDSQQLNNSERLANEAQPLESENDEQPEFIAVIDSLKQLILKHMKNTGGKLLVKSLGCIIDFSKGGSKYAQRVQQEIQEAIRKLQKEATEVPETIVLDD